MASGNQNREITGIVFPLTVGTAAPNSSVSARRWRCCPPYRRRHLRDFRGVWWPNAILLEVVVRYGSGRLTPVGKALISGRNFQQLAEQSTPFLGQRRVQTLQKTAGRLDVRRRRCQHHGWRDHWGVIYIDIKQRMPHCSVVLSLTFDEAAEYLENKKKYRSMAFRRRWISLPRTRSLPIFQCCGTISYQENKPVQMRAE